MLFEFILIPALPDVYVTLVKVSFNIFAISFVSSMTLPLVVIAIKLVFLCLPELMLLFIIFQDVLTKLSIWYVPTDFRCIYA
jgi:hypothetical protein